MAEMTTIELEKEYLKFSAAHFTVFSSTERERLHGHNFRVAARISAPVGHNGMCFSYGIFKRKLKTLCDELDEFLLLPAESPYLKITDLGNEYQVLFNDDVMRFLKGDVLVLPLRNVTVEELARYLLEQLIADEDVTRTYAIQAITIRVSSGPGQWGSCSWVCSD